MTEQEWLVCTDPRPMMQALGATIDGPLGSGLTERKRRLWACACCRQVWGPLVGTQRFDEAMSVAEKFADGLVSAAEVEAAQRVAEKLTADLLYLSSRGSYLEGHAALLREVLGNPYRPMELPRYPPRWLPCASCGKEEMLPFGANRTRTRCQACGRFGPAVDKIVVPTPCPWHTPLVVAIARDVYDTRRWDMVGIVADALEEAGCDYRPLLAHLREPGPHVLGCCALDVLLGKT